MVHCQRHVEFTYHSTKTMVATGCFELGTAKFLFFAHWLVEKQTVVKLTADKDLEGVEVNLGTGGLGLALHT